MDSPQRQGPIRILVLEDLEDDYVLLLRELTQAGIEFESERADTPAGLQRALLEHDWDIILSDYNMPAMNALTALEIVKGSRPGIPFVVISGSIGEEVAVELIRAGAADYLIKDRLARLPAILARELRDSVERSERRKLEQELRHLQKLEVLGTLASGIVHDVNNSLTVISGFSELAALALADNHPAREFVEQIELAARRSREIARRILRFSRRDQHDAPPERIDLRDPVRAAVSLLRPALPANVDLHFAAGSAAFEAHGNAQEIEQAIINICNNAAQAIGARDGRIAISLETVQIQPQQRPLLLTPGEYHKLSVADNGGGIAPEVRERIFEPFFTTKPDGEGTGLGLAMAQRMLADMGGAVTCESALGEGATFSLYFPALGAVADHAAPAAATDAAAGRVAHIMVVDDEAMLVNLNAKVLQQAGYRCTRFFDPDSALSAFIARPESYDLLLTDMAMPGMTGLELSRRLREIRAELPVIVGSGYVGDAEATLFKDFNAVLLKPYSSADLIGAVKSTLATHPPKAFIESDWS